MGHLIGASRAVVSLRGDLDATTVHGLRETFATTPAPDTIEMSGVGLVTSAALIEFVLFAKRMGRRRVVVLDAQPGIARLFRILGMDRIFLLANGRATK
jgi:anti-anti-sigma factor